MVREFMGLSAGGIDFSAGIIGVHPKLRKLRGIKNRKIQNKMIGRYFDLFYNKHKDYLNERKKEFNKEWQTVEKSYFSEVKKIFKNQVTIHHYIGYLSIINCNPRFLSKRNFQIFYYHPRGVIYVAAHEILHFIFYDYCFKKFPGLFKNLNTEEGLFWDLAEIFNVIILSLPQFKKIHGQRKMGSYPVHKRYLYPLKKYWQEADGIDRWVIKSFNYLNKFPHAAVLPQND